MTEVDGAPIANLDATPLVSPVGHVDADDVRHRIETIGYAILHDVVDVAALQSIRDFWIAEFAKPTPAAPMIWGPYLGERNGALYDDGATHCLYRSFDYLWNAPYETLTRQTAIALNRIRNRIIGEDRNFGELMAADGYGVYVTTSFYPCGSGWMHLHEDFADGRKHWHFVLPVTHRGIDYAEGGLALIDRNGNRVDVDGQTRPGSVIFYDGTLPHCVDKIEGQADMHTGRLQLFAIPSFFEPAQNNQRFLADVSLYRLARAKLAPLKRRILGGPRK